LDVPSSLVLTKWKVDLYVAIVIQQEEIKILFLKNRLLVGILKSRQVVVDVLFDEDHI
jgi:hypothetical protein